MRKITLNIRVEQNILGGHQYMFLPSDLCTINHVTEQSYGILYSSVHCSGTVCSQYLVGKPHCPVTLQVSLL